MGISQGQQDLPKQSYKEQSEEREREKDRVGDRRTKSLKEQERR